RTDNRPQFMSAKFAKTCQELKLIHERIPVKTPNMNAHIEAFNSILEEECYVVSGFTNFRETYDIFFEIF
ncbi:Integrase core domain-containing protein, partial [Thermosyntropha lipolytica DSM 11003]